ncbi:hypothetical protein ABZP36_007063 [Zizania latifolia]
MRRSETTSILHKTRRISSKQMISFHVKMNRHGLYALTQRAAFPERKGPTGQLAMAVFPLSIWSGKLTVVCSCCLSHLINIYSLFVHLSLASLFAGEIRDAFLNLFTCRSNLPSYRAPFSNSNVESQI